MGAKSLERTAAPTETESRRAAGWEGNASMTSLTYADLARPADRQKALIYDLTLVMGGSVLLALCARVSFYLGAVPTTGQTFGVLLIGALLGSRRGTLAVAAYLGEGAAGLPVFASGMAGIPYMLGPTGGYLLGFLPAAWLAGALAERGWDKRVGTTLLAMTLSDGVVFAVGLLWLAAATAAAGTADASTVLTVGLLPFLPGEVLKICLATALLPTGWKLLRGAGNTD